MFAPISTSLSQWFLPLESRETSLWGREARWTLLGHD